MSGIRDLQPASPFSCLEHMRFDAELHPRRCIATWVEGRALNLLEDRVVLARVPPEVRLDGNQLGAQKAFLCQHEGLDDASDSSVAVAKGVDGHQVEMRHRAPNHRVAREIA